MFSFQNGNNGVSINGLGRTPPKENGLDLGLASHKKDAVSPHSATSSNSSTPVPKKSAEDSNGKPSTPKSARSTPPGPEAGLKPGLPGPPYGIGFSAPPPGANIPAPPTNGHPPSDTAFRFNDSLRAPPVGLPSNGKP